MMNHFSKSSIPLFLAAALAPFFVYGATNVVVSVADTVSSVAILEKTQVAAVTESQSTPQVTATATTASDISDASKAQLQMLTTLLVSPKTSSTTDKTTQSVGATGSNNQSLQAEAALALKRQVIMKELAKKNPQQFLMYTMSDSQRKALSPAAQLRVERKVSITCPLRVLHIDDFDNYENSTFKYSCGRYEVLSPQKFEGRRSGPVKISAWIIDDLMVLDRGEASITPAATRVTQGTAPLVPSAQQGTEALGNQRVLALITEMQGETSPVIVSDVEQVLFASSSPFQTYYRENSYGKMYFSGKAYKINPGRNVTMRSGLACGDDVNVYDEDVLQAIKLQNIDLGQYDRVLFVASSGYCSEVGKSSQVIDGKSYSFSQSWVRWNYFRDAFNYNQLNGTIAHEIGHALGVEHANFLSCDQVDVCRHEEYGNYYDEMGRSLGYGGHFNALYKEQLGWLTSNDFVNITTSGNYSMNALESVTGKKAAKIVNPLVGPLSVIYLEKRIKDRSDVGGQPQNNGLLLNIPQSPSRLSASHVELIDMNPGYPAANDSLDVVLKQGKSFEQPSYGVTIGPVKSVDTSSANFDISVHNPGCYRRPPRVTFTSSYGSQYLPTFIEVAGGADLPLNFTIVNEDPPCAAPTSYSMEFTDLHSGWNILPEVSNLTQDNLPPSQETRLYSTIRIPKTGSYGYGAGINAILSISGLRPVNIPLNISVLPTPRIIALSPNSLSFVEPPTYVSGSSISVETNHGDGVSSPYLYLTDEMGQLPRQSQLPFSGTPDSLGKIQITIPNDIKPGYYNLVYYAKGANSEPYLIRIASTLSLLSPNGGQSYTAGLSYPVSWTTNATSSIPTVKITLVSANTTDPGTPAVRTELTPFITNDGIENVTIPRSTPAGNYKIEVSGIDVNSYSRESISDISDTTFAVTSPISTLTLLSPNGGTRYNSGLSYPVTWTTNATSSIPSVNIYLVSLSTSSPSRVLLTPIGRTPNDGSENITIPRGTSPGRYKIEVGGPVNVTNQYISDVSDWPLDIVPVTVVTPPSQLHPVDANRDRRITISEVSDYARSFGNTVETRTGGEISKRGESYSYDNGSQKWRDSRGVIVEDGSVTITRISQPIYQGRTLSFDGRGFASTSKVLIDGKYYGSINSRLTISTTSISFIVPLTLGPLCSGYNGPCNIAAATSTYRSTIGAHTLAVTNGASTTPSNLVNFVVGTERRY